MNELEKEKYLASRRREGSNGRSVTFVRYVFFVSNN